MGLFFAARVVTGLFRNYSKHLQASCEKIQCLPFVTLVLSLRRPPCLIYKCYISPHETFWGGPKKLDRIESSKLKTVTKESLWAKRKSSIVPNSSQSSLRGSRNGIDPKSVEISGNTKTKPSVVGGQWIR